MQIKNLAEGF